MKPAEKQQVLELLLQLARKSIDEQEFTTLFGNESPARISEVTLALRDSKPFLQTLRNQLEAVGRVAGCRPDECLPGLCGSHGCRSGSG